MAFMPYIFATAAPAVGSIPAEFNVSPTGAATYEIPIECPTGVGGLKPELKFVYSSQLGDGLLGCGWTISGLSAITRYPKSEGYEAFAIDGARLVKISKFSNMAEFRSENDIYTRIVGYEPQDHGFKYFKVFTKDGKTLIYGSIEGSGSGAAWPLTEVYDANGNYMTFQDITSYGGDINSNTGRIIYGKNKSGAGMETVIEFEYEQSPNAFTQYLCGKAIDKWARVKRVRVLGNGFLPTVDYDLKYMDGGAKTDRSRLTGISCSKGASNIGSTSFTWMENNYGIKSVKDPNLSTISAWRGILGISVGDITGSGKCSKLLMHSNNTFTVYPELDGEGLCQSDRRYDDVCLYDMDGDGVDEIIAAYSYSHRGGSDKEDYREIHHSLGKYNPSTKRIKWQELYTPSYVNGYYAQVADRMEEVMGDFYGSGKPQFIPLTVWLPKEPDDADKAAYIISSIMGAKKASLSGRKGSTTLQSSRYSGGYLPSIADVKSADIFAIHLNGSGKTTLLGYAKKKGMVRCYEEQNGKFVEIITQKVTPAPATYTLGDFNGDGNTDLLLVKDGKVEVWLSTGKEFVLSSMGDGIEVKSGINISAIDVNGSGRSDLYVTDDDSARLYLSTGSGFELVASDNNSAINPDASSEEQIRKYIPIISTLDGIDINGSRYMECLDGVIEFSPNKVFDKIVKIEDGMHNTFSLEYGKKERVGVVVTSVKSSNLNGEVESSRYVYGKILYDSNLRSVMGFSTVSRTDEVSGRSVVNSFSVNNSTVQLDRTDEIVGAAKVKSFTYSYDVKTFGLNLRTSLVTKETEHDYLTGLERSVEYQNYDDYGNPEKVVTKQGGQTVTQDMTYIKLGLNSFRPSRIQTTYSYGGSSTVKIQVLNYDDNGNLTSESGNGVTKSYGNYDVFGNCQSIRYASGVNYRAEEMTYTASGRHLESKTDAFGEKTEYKWDERKDLLLEEKDAYGHKTTYKYDDLGGLKNKTTADGVTVSTETKWAERNNVYKASYIVETTTSGNGTVTTWYTSDGREVCKKQKGLGGKDVYVVKEYNKDGTLSKISKPSFENMPREWAEQYIYDRYGRPISITGADGRTNINYSGLTTTVITPSEKVSKTLTPEGFTESVTTNGKTVRYTYYPTGELKTATPDGGEPVYMEYDKWGNRIKITDAESGTVTKKYNAFGELMESSHKQGSGATVTTSYTYSPKGLLTQKNRGGDITNYIYDSQNRLISKTMAGGISQSYEYDKFDRIVKTIDKLDSREFVRETSYDSEGRVQRETYPSGYYTENVYDENGVLVTVTDANGNEIYRPLEATASGRITRESRGGKVTEFLYDKADRLIRKNSDNKIIDQVYKYDKRNNLCYYLDATRGNVFIYVYDNLDRLTSWNVHSVSGYKFNGDTITYDESNNMVHKNSLGDMILAYEDENHPHAVSSISGVPSAFPKDEQNITYTSFNKVESVSQGDMRYDITYGVGEQRIKSEYSNAQGKTTRYYIGNYEEVIDAQGATTKFCYLSGGAMMVEKDGEQKLYYNYTDRLGSIVAIADAEGNVIERYAYDPWGKRLDPKNLSKKDTRTSLFNNRGYTGHEHIDGLDLINMNGRMYDPLLGMFMSTDPFIQAPDNWLNYNRYLYGFGNPMKYIDPSGNIGIAAVIGIGAAIGAVLGTGAGLWYGYNQGYTGWDLAKSALIGAGIGVGVGAFAGVQMYNGINSIQSAKTLWHFMSLGATIGANAGIVGGTIYGLANKADGWELASCALTGYGVGMVAGAIIGAGCYKLYSLYVKALANYSAATNALVAAEVNYRNAVSAEFADAMEADFAEIDFNNADINQDSMFTLEQKRIDAEELAQKTLFAAKEKEKLYDLAVVGLTKASHLVIGTKVFCPIGATVLIGGVSTGAGYGYYQLTNLWLKD